MKGRVSDPPLQTFNWNLSSSDAFEICPIPIADSIISRAESEIRANQRIGYIIIQGVPACLWAVVEIPDKGQPDIFTTRHPFQCFHEKLRLFFQCIIQREFKAYRIT